MDEGEKQEADAFYADDYVFILFHTDHIAFIAFELATCDAHMLVLLEIRFGKYLAAGCIVGGKQTN